MGIYMPIRKSPSGKKMVGEGKPGIYFMYVN